MAELKLKPQCVMCKRQFTTQDVLIASCGHCYCGACLKDENDEIIIENCTHCEEELTSVCILVLIDFSSKSKSTGNELIPANEYFTNKDKTSASFQLAEVKEQNERLRDEMESNKSIIIQLRNKLKIGTENRSNDQENLGKKGSTQNNKDIIVLEQKLTFAQNEIRQLREKSSTKPSRGNFKSRPSRSYLGPPRGNQRPAEQFPNYQYQPYTMNQN
uniref:RING-type domain-containing protein n=1 Tax=Rhabditophanes sp. KR3021 TaxID=114890 RepID=A0AC35TJ13_9BILA